MVMGITDSVSLPFILIKIKVDQMLPSSYISSLWSLFYDFAFDFLFPLMYGFILGLNGHFLFYDIGNKKNIIPPPSPN